MRRTLNVPNLSAVALSGHIYSNTRAAVALSFLAWKNLEKANNFE